MLTFDDFAYAKNEKPSQSKLRTTQSVVFELGYLLNRLGRENIFVLYLNKPNFQRPTNYFDIVYTPYDHFDKKDTWKKELIQKLEHWGYNIRKERL